MPPNEALMFHVMQGRASAYHNVLPGSVNKIVREVQTFLWRPWGERTGVDASGADGQKQNPPEPRASFAEGAAGTAEVRDYRARGAESEKSKEQPQPAPLHPLMSGFRKAFFFEAKRRSETEPEQREQSDYDAFVSPMLLDSDGLADRFAPEIEGRKNGTFVDSNRPWFSRELLYYWAVLRHNIEVEKKLARGETGEWTDQPWFVNQHRD